MSEGVPTLTDAYQQGRDDERAVLLPISIDLIAELRRYHVPRFGDCGECDQVWPCVTSVFADRAEARLREVGDA